MNTNDLVSVVVTTYKRSPDILMRAVNSVLAQSYPNWECIVVNDAPAEAALSEEIRSTLEGIGDPRIRYIVHERNLGSNAARNTGISAAGGAFIAFLDDDDCWAPGKLERQLEAFASHPDAAMVYGAFEMVMDGKSFHVAQRCPGLLPLPTLLEYNVIGPTSFPLIRTSVLKELGSFDPEQKCCQDYELWLRIATHYPVVGIEDSMGTRYIIGDSVFHNLDLFIANDRRILQKYQDCYRKYPRAHGNHLLGKFLYTLREGNYRYAFRYKLDAWRADPTNPDNLFPVMLARKVWKKYVRQR